MDSVVSKMISDRQKLADDAVSWAEVHGPSITQAVAERLGPECRVDVMIQRLVKELVTATKTIVLTDEAHTAEIADDAEPRARRNELGAKVARTLQDARSAVEVGHGPAGLAAIGLAAPLPKDGRQLERVGKRVLELGKADGFKLPKPKREGTEVRISVYLKELETNFKAYQKALDDVQREESEFDGTMLAKKNALHTFNTVFGDFIDAMSTLARLAGMSELGDKLPSLWWRTASNEDEAPAVDVGEAAPPVA